MDVLVACDKFRGSLTAAEANETIASALSGSRLSDGATVTEIAIADGGEGTLDALRSSASREVVAKARDAFGTLREASFLYDDTSRRAVIEMARVAGHACVKDGNYDPDRATSAGVGDLIKAALEAGATEIVVSLGGSVTVDGGAGALEAFGARYLDDTGAVLEGAVGRALGRVATVDLSQMTARPEGVTIVVAADVDNPLNGERGAAAVFGPQKGVAKDDIGAFDDALAAFDRAVAAATGRDPMTDTPFAGAAGGMMVGLSAIAPVEPRDGFALVSQQHDLPARIRAADLVVTGEGSLDSQSLSGKGPVGIARMAAEAGVPAIAFAGRLAVTRQELEDNGIIAAFSISQEPQSLDDALQGARDALLMSAHNAFNAIAAGRLLR